MPRLTPFQQRMLEVLRHGEATTRELAQSVYASNPDGGPLWGEAAIYVQIHRMRRKGVALRYLGRRRGYAVADSAAASSKG